MLVPCNNTVGEGSGQTRHRLYGLGMRSEATVDKRNVIKITSDVIPNKILATVYVHKSVKAFSEVCFTRANVNRTHIRKHRRTAVV